MMNVQPDLRELIINTCSMMAKYHSEIFRSVLHLIF